MVQMGPKDFLSLKNSAFYTYNHTCNQGQKSLDRLFPLTPFIPLEH